MPRQDWYDCDLLKPGKICDLEVARVNEFLSIGVESSTSVVENTTTKDRRIEMNMLVTTSLMVDDQNTTLAELKSENTSIVNDIATVTTTEATTAMTRTQAVVDTTVTPEEVEASGEMPSTEQAVPTTTVLERETG